MDHSHMDHSGMDHSKMDHSHMDHSGMDQGGMGDRCSMNMLFTWNTQNLCIVFRQWHVRSTTSLVVSLLFVVALAAGYEALREASRRYETKVNQRVEAMPRRNQVEASKSAHIIKAALYALQNFYAFMLMLVFMTYNGWVMGAVAVGAFVGYLAFGSSAPATKANACH